MINISDNFRYAVSYLCERQGISLNQFWEKIGFAGSAKRQHRHSFFNNYSKAKLEKAADALDVDVWMLITPLSELKAHFGEVSVQHTVLKTPTELQSLLHLKLIREEVQSYMQNQLDQLSHGIVQSTLNAIKNGELDTSIMEPVAESKTSGSDPAKK